MLSSVEIKRCAAALGFSACGMTRAEAVSSARAEELRRWLAEGCHADMDYLARNVEKKLDPRLLVEGAKTIVSLAVNYYPGENEIFDEKGEKAWHLARYAYGTDYHEVVKHMLRQLLAMLHLEEGKDGRCFVDTAPVDEKYWAQRCGLGWRGRNSQLVIPGMGSYFFLGELVLTHEVDIYDEPLPNRCGKCDACLHACPAHALKGDGTLDARKCISYLTIEHRGELPDGTGDLMNGCIYGCDRCAEACPWNKRFARPTQIADLQPRASLLAMKPADWRSLTLDDYRSLFKKSAVKRAKFEGLTRNIDALSRSLAQHRKKMNIAIFVSGNGSNCENLIRHFNVEGSVARVALVISNKADAYALERANRLNVPSKVLTKAEINDEKTLLPLLDSYDIGFVVLAGFMLMAPDFLVTRFERRMVNIHPSLLPKFGGKGMYGHHVHEAVKAAGETETGITIHYVSSVCDGGGIIAQYATPVAPEDTADDIERKVRALEQEYFPLVIEEVLFGLFKH